MKKKIKIITYEEIDHIAMEFLTKQKIKHLHVCGGEKEKIFVTKMMNKFVKNHGFSEKDLQKLTKYFEEFCANQNKSNSNSL